MKTVEHQTIKVVQTFDANTIALTDALNTFKKKVNETIDFNSPGGIEITLQELKLLRNFAEDIEHKACRFVDICNQEIKAKAVDDMKRTVRDHVLSTGLNID